MPEEHEQTAENIDNSKPVADDCSNCETLRQHMEGLRQLLYKNGVVNLCTLCSFAAETPEQLNEHLQKTHGMVNENSAKRPDKRHKKFFGKHHPYSTKHKTKVEKDSSDLPYSSYDTPSNSDSDSGTVTPSTSYGRVDESASLLIQINVVSVDL